MFIHGIGLGFSHYLILLSSLPRDTDIFLVEWPYVAQQMAIDAPAAPTAVSALVNTLDHFGHKERGATFLAHSLGTVMVAWMLHDKVGRNYIATSTVLDPITYLLADPTVASNFVYKDPIDELDLLMHFFLSR